MFKIITKILKKIKEKIAKIRITDRRGSAGIDGTREILTPQNPDMSREINPNLHNSSQSSLTLREGEADNKKSALGADSSASRTDTINTELSSKNSIAGSEKLSSHAGKGVASAGNRTLETLDDNSVSRTSPLATPNSLYQNSEIPKNTAPEASVLEIQCPYCRCRDFVKRGTRKKKYEVVQLYLCKNEECSRTFTSQSVKGKHFPLNIIIEAMSYYNLGFTLEETCKVIGQKFGAAPEPATLSGWLSEYKELCRYERLRPWAVKLCSPKDTVEVVTMAHRQLYRFRYHRAKMALMLEEFPNRRLSPLKEYLDNVSAETPHQYFSAKGGSASGGQARCERMSEIRSKFDKAEMIVKSKFNYANRLAGFVLQAVRENKKRHEALQRFMLACDSVTVASEVPVYIRQSDIEHMENQLGFKILDEQLKLKGGKTIPLSGGKLLLTGHIDLVQVRNGQAHLLDFKPAAASEKPVEQLTWYALALSRLTGLRLFEFKCGWFDEKDYFEFFPLHVVYKIRSKRKRKVHYRSGQVAEIPKKDVLTIVKDKARNRITNI